MAAPLAPNRNTLWASIFVDELARAGVRVACLSPGSRSTPLVLALASHPAFKLHTLLDERGSGFFALGLAKTLGEPVAVLCTSGTAAANLHPAVLEASHAEVPLIVLTADRPPEARDTGAGQAVDQLHLFGRAVRWFFEVGTPDLRESALRHLRTLPGRAVFQATRHPAGPVHLNFPFHKPLEPTDVPGDVPAALEQEAPLALHGFAGAAFSKGTAGAPQPPAKAIEALAKKVLAEPRGLILCGPMSFTGNGGATSWRDWPQALAALARRAGYPVLAEPPSQVRSGPHDASHVIAHAEALLRCEGFRRRLDPQWVLRFGAMPTGKQQEVLLEEHPACPVVVVNPAGTWLEPTHHPTEVIAADPGLFCSALAEALPQGSRGAPEWLGLLRQADDLAAAALREAYDAPAPQGLGGEWFEGRVFQELADALPEGALQFTASSMPVRDLEAFTPATNRRVRHLVNRGVNGIDGTLSTGLGAAAAHRFGAAQGGTAPAVLVTGDLAFLHDANALLTAKTQGISLTVVLLNNDGGGIFEFLPIAGYGAAYETHFGTPHGTDFHALCVAFGVPLLRPGSWEEFRRQLQDGFGAAGTRVIEIRTDRRRNREQHRVMWDAVARRLGQAGLAGQAPR